MYLRELRYFLGLMVQINCSARGEAASALGRRYAQGINTSVPLFNSSDGRFVIRYLLVLLFLFTSEVALVCTICFFGYQTSKNIVRFESYAFASNTRLPRAYEAVFHLYNAYLGKDSDNFVSVETELKRVDYLMDLIDDTSFAMLSKSAFGGSIMGLDPRIDSLVLGCDCHIPPIPDSIHDLYECTYTTNLLIVLRQFMSEVIQILPESNGVIAGVPLISIKHLVMVHLTEQSKRMDAILSTIIQERVEGFRRLLIGCFISGILLSVIFFLVVCSLLGILDDIFHAAIVLVKRLPPHAIAGNSDLLNYLMKGKSSRNRNEMAIEQSVLYLANDGILCVNKDHIIEFMNPAITELTGYSPAQTLGCRVTFMFIAEFRSSIESIVNNGEPIESQVICLTENGGEVKCHLVSFWVNRDKNTERCILVLSDISEIESKRIAAEEAQLIVNKLKNVILPSEIENRTKAEGFVFQVPFASVMSLRLGQFILDHGAPQELMNRLNLIFQAFEKRMKHFTGITKVRVFGTSILYAAGLLSEARACGANDLVAFAQDCIEMLEDLNIKNYAEYTVQIGIHTGGPIICSLVNDGVEFDILGDCVNVAIVMQKTAPPNTLQISDSTYAMLENVTFVQIKRLVTFRGKEYSAHLLRTPGASGSSS
jgi:PAS domain S-box-containing protein